jgi:hypothetical protein
MFLLVFTLFSSFVFAADYSCTNSSCDLSTARMASEDNSVVNISENINSTLSMSGSENAPLKRVRVDGANRTINSLNFDLRSNFNKDTSSSGNTTLPSSNALVVVKEVGSVTLNTDGETGRNGKDFDEVCGDEIKSGDIDATLGSLNSIKTAFGTKNKCDSTDLANINTFYAPSSQGLTTPLCTSVSDVSTEYKSAATTSGNFDVKRVRPKRSCLKFATVRSCRFKTQKHALAVATQGPTAFDVRGDNPSLGGPGREWIIPSSCSNCLYTYAGFTNKTFYDVGYLVPTGTIDADSGATSVANYVPVGTSGTYDIVPADPSLGGSSNQIGFIMMDSTWYTTLYYGPTHGVARPAVYPTYFYSKERNKIKNASIPTPAAGSYDIFNQCIYAASDQIPAVSKATSGLQYISGCSKFQFGVISIWLNEETVTNNNVVDRTCDSFGAEHYPNHVAEELSSSTTSSIIARPLEQGCLSGEGSGAIMYDHTACADGVNCDSTYTDGYTQSDEETISCNGTSCAGVVSSVESVTKKPISIQAEDGESGSRHGNATVVTYKFTGSLSQSANRGSDGNNGKTAADLGYAWVNDETRYCLNIQDEDYWDSKDSTYKTNNKTASYRQTPVTTIKRVTYNPLDIIASTRTKTVYPVPTAEENKVFTHADYNTRVLINELAATAD